MTKGGKEDEILNPAHHDSGDYPKLRKEKILEIELYHDPLDSFWFPSRSLT